MTRQAWACKSLWHGMLIAGLEIQFFTTLEYKARV